jgi:predicted HTH transcriptional regulator
MTTIAPPPCPFGPWEQLRLADVRAFLRGKPAERTIWEAKRHASKAELSTFVRKESCAFANRRGGYLLLGAEDEKGSGWTLRGVVVPGVKELHDWIASLLRELKPLPSFDVHEWGLSNGRKVAVVQIDPAPIPPVSYGGRVHIRHGSQTLVADGPAISRLSNEGARAIRVVERATRKRAKEEASQFFAPMAIAIGAQAVAIGR